MSLNAIVKYYVVDFEFDVVRGMCERPQMCVCVCVCVVVYNEVKLMDCLLL